MTRYTHNEIIKLAETLTSRLNRERIKLGIENPEIKIVVHTWNNLKCLRITKPQSDTPTGESEFSRYFNTYEDLASLIDTIHAALTLVET